MFERVFAFTLGAEGAFTADARDKGNWTGGECGKGVLKGTKYGISAAAYPDLDIQRLTLADAREIYRRDYWAKVSGDSLPWPVAVVVFDYAVHSGAGTAARALQRAVGVRDDGAIGPVTLAAVAKAESFDVAAEILAQRTHALPALPGWWVYGLGWTRRMMKLAFHAAAP